MSTDTTTESEFNLRSYPFVAWIFSALTSLLVLAYLASLATRPGSLSAENMWVPVMLVPLFIACAVWLGSRPSYTVSIDRQTRRLRVGQTWPIENHLDDIALDEIASISIRNLASNDGVTYRVVATTKSGTETTLSTEFNSKQRAERLAEAIRAALSQQSDLNREPF